MRVSQDLPASCYWSKQPPYRWSNQYAAKHSLGLLPRALTALIVPRIQTVLCLPLPNPDCSWLIVEDTVEACLPIWMALLLVLVQTPWFSRRFVPTSCPMAWRTVLELVDGCALRTACSSPSTGLWAAYPYSATTCNIEPAAREGEVLAWVLSCRNSDKWALTGVPVSACIPRLWNELQSCGTLTCIHPVACLLQWMGRLFNYSLGVSALIPNQWQSKIMTQSPWSDKVKVCWRRGVTHS